LRGVLLVHLQRSGERRVHPACFNVDDLEAEVADLQARGVNFEDYDSPDLRTVEGIATIEGNYPSKGTAERGAWFRDSEGNMISMGQALP
jgi:hypothetical protein